MGHTSKFDRFWLFYIKMSEKCWKILHFVTMLNRFSFFRFEKWTQHVNEPILTHFDQFLMKMIEKFWKILLFDTILNRFSFFRFEKWAQLQNLSKIHSFRPFSHHVWSKQTSKHLILQKNWNNFKKIRCLNTFRVGSRRLGPRERIEATPVTGARRVLVQ